MIGIENDNAGHEFCLGYVPTSVEKSEGHIMIGIEDVKASHEFRLHPQNVLSLLEQLPQGVLDLLLDAPGNASTSWPTMSARRPCPTAR